MPNPELPKRSANPDGYLTGADQAAMIADYAISIAILCGMALTGWAIITEVLSGLEWLQTGTYDPWQTRQAFAALGVPEPRTSWVGLQSVFDGILNGSFLWTSIIASVALIVSVVWIAGKVKSAIKGAALKRQRADRDAAD